MKFSEVLGRIQSIQILSEKVRVERTVAEEAAGSAGRPLPINVSPGMGVQADVLVCGVVTDKNRWASLDPALPKKTAWMWVRVRKEGGVELLVSHTHLLYGLWRWVQEEWDRLPREELERGLIRVPAFEWVRPQYDLFLIQHARSVRRFDPEAYVVDLARIGYSHVEVNALASHLPLESGPKGEVYHRFYTYCPALDQFVSSRLNRGIYDQEYLQANLNLLKRYVDLGDKFGLAPGLLCFEPRTVPDELLQRYPMLRGARVDHPFRSFRPRYTLSLGHPVVRDHYAELMTALMKEVPTLEYIDILSNDSGAGFEYTNSLYAGRNGGGYVIREWKGDQEIAAAAAMNLVRFHRLLRDAGRAVNPRFRVLMRFEAFWTEHEHIWKELEEGLDVEVTSLLEKGWGLAHQYHHPKYHDVAQVHGTALFAQFDEKEKPVIEDLRKKRSTAHILCSMGVIWNHEPLMSAPFPGLVFEKLHNLIQQGVTAMANLGGATPSAFAPFNINQEVFRAFLRDPALDLERFLQNQAVRWVGQDTSKELVAVWTLAEEAFRSFPVPVWIYSAWGVWYRLLIRPIIPNIEALSEEERAYYEQFLLATSHNRARVDFRYDVGFDLVEPIQAGVAVQRMDQDLFPALEKALSIAKTMKESSRGTQAGTCWEDLSDRLRAWKCWFRTQRNVAVWVAEVHAYLGTTDEAQKQFCRSILRDMVLDEIANTKDLLELWETSSTEWMIVSGAGETTFIYDEHFGDHLKRKIALMTGRENDVPYVDPEFQWRVPDFTN